MARKSHHEDSQYQVTSDGCTVLAGSWELHAGTSSSLVDEVKY